MAESLRTQYRVICYAPDGTKSGAQYCDDIFDAEDLAKQAYQAGAERVLVSRRKISQWHHVDLSKLGEAL